VRLLKVGSSMRLMGEGHQVKLIVVQTDDVQTLENPKLLNFSK
jgi:hypothetical protein